MSKPVIGLGLVQRIKTDHAKLPIPILSTFDMFSFDSDPATPIQMSFKFSTVNTW